MATPDTDIGQLSEEQQLALDQYTSVTAQDVQSAIALLQRSEWNVQVSREKTTSLCRAVGLLTPG
jgi:FAS-associated factor 2